MTVKELIAELVQHGYEESELKGKKKAELEELLKEVKGERSEEPETEEVKEEKVEEDTEKEDSEGGNKGEKGQVVRETSQQLGIFRDYIYNVKYKKAKVVIENLGYGDVYYDTEDLAVVGQSNRLMFGQMVELEGIDKVCFASASQPVVQIIEVM